LKAFVLLELMNHMVLVADEAKRRGHRVIACNHDTLRRSGPFAVDEGLVDEVVRIESWSDHGEVDRVLTDITSRYEIAGTYAGFEATLPYEAMLRERAGLPTNGAGTVEAVLDKTALRRKLYAEGLSHLQSVSMSEALTWTSWEFGGPAVLKPAHGTGSALCFRVSSVDALRRAAELVEVAAVVNPLMREYIVSHGEFVLEEMAQGELLSVESLVHRGRVRTVGLMGRYVLASDPVVEMGLLFPYHHPRYDDIVATAEALHRSAGIVHGPTHLEVMVPDEGPIELIDFNVRLAGVGSMVLFSEAFGVPYAAPVTDIACGIEPDLSFVDRPTRFAAEVFILPPPATTRLCHVSFPSGTSCQRLPKELGQQLSGRADQLDHVGMFVVSGDRASDVHRRALDARRETEVNGVPLGDNVNNVVAYSRYLGRDLQPTTRL
jgi:hypothetical protein